MKNLSTNLLRALGLLLIVLPLLPLASIFGPLPDQHSFRPPASWIGGIALVISLGGVAQLLVPQYFGNFCKAKWRDFLKFPDSRFLLLAISLYLAIVFKLTLALSSGSPFFLDALVQSFQAQTFASGRVVLERPVHPEFFLIPNVVLDQTTWYSQFPPLHALLLSIGLFFGSELLAILILCAGTILFFYFALKNIYGLETARLSTILLLTSCPFFLIINLSFMNHISTLFLICAAFWALSTGECSSGLRPYLLAGLCLGSSFLVRPLTALATFPIFLFATLRAKKVSASILFTVGFFFAASLLYAYNAATTGEFFVSGYEKLWGSAHQLGFHQTPWGFDHSALRGLKEQLLNLYLLEDSLFSWPIPSLWLLGILLFKFPYTLKSWDRYLLSLLALTLLAYLCYWHRDSLFGPRYIYCAAIMSVIPLTARVLILLKEALSNSAQVIFTLLGVAIVFSNSITLLIRLPGLQAQNSIYRESAIKTAQGAGIESGLIFVAVPWAQRVTNQLRAADFPPTLVDRAYLQGDICELHLMLTQFQQKIITREEMQKVLEQASRDHVQAKLYPGNIIARLKDPKNIAESCAEELRYDALGYTSYLPHFLENRFPLDRPFIVAIDLRAKNKLLVQDFPGLKPYLYRNGSLQRL
ncbi:glycosyltransferase family 39 protein [bacterium]|nr:glycosyltransferase family 39 protein [bacterium]